MIFILFLYYDTPGIHLTTDNFAPTKDKIAHTYAGAGIGLLTPIGFDYLNNVTSNEKFDLQVEARNYVCGLTIASFIAAEKEYYDYRHGGRLDLADYAYTLLGYTIGFMTNRLFKYVILKDNPEPDVKVYIQFLEP